MEGMMEVGVRRGTYKLMYEAGSEDLLWRRRGRGESRLLATRAAAREEERRREIWNKLPALIGITVDGWGKAMATDRS